MELIPFRGTLSLCGTELESHIQRLSPGSQVEIPHMTILAKHEVQKLGLDLDLEKTVKISQESLQILSVGKVKEVEYLTVSWTHAQLYRKKLGLEPKAFHITLSKVDRHDILKDFTTTEGGYPAFTKVFRELPEEGQSLHCPMEYKVIFQLSLNTFSDGLHSGRSAYHIMATSTSSGIPNKISGILSSSHSCC